MERPVLAWAVLAPAIAVAAVTAFWLRTRLAAAVATGLLAASGAALGWGGMLLRTHPSAGEVVAAVILSAVLVPAHVRIVLGRFGPPGAREETPATRAEPSREAPRPPP